jgi:multiple sugar transport system permease protein
MPMSDILQERVTKATPPAAARYIKSLSDRWIAWIFVAPTVFLLLAINIFPLIWTIRLSLTNYRANPPNRPIEFVGLDNCRLILTDPDIWNTMQVTSHFLIWTIVLQVLFDIALAWLINRKFTATICGR